MTDRELDALVAEKVMGWKRYGNTVRDSWWEGGHRAASWNWSPSTGIAAAWQVVEKIVGEQHDWKFELRFISGRPAPGRIWAKFVRWKGQEEFEGYANEAPRAISLAALKAVGVEVQ